MNYTREQLYTLPLQVLRGIDIKTQEEERLVQEVVNERLADLPVDMDMTVNSMRTDNMTPEKEAILQAELNAEVAAKKAKLKPTLEGDFENEKEKFTAPEVLIIPTEELQPVTEVTKAPFCQFCSSKGVRHKKECTRLSANNTI